MDTIRYQRNRTTTRRGEDPNTSTQPDPVRSPAADPASPGYGSRTCGALPSIVQPEPWLDPSSCSGAGHRTFMSETSENPAGLCVRPQGFLVFRRHFFFPAFPLPLPAFPTSLYTDNAGYPTYSGSGSYSPATVLL